MSNEHFVREVTLQPGEGEKHKIPARYFHITKGTGELKLGFNGQHPKTIRPGFERSPDGGFDEFEIVNADTVPQTIEFVATDDVMKDRNFHLEGGVDIQRGENIWPDLISVGTVATLLSLGNGRKSLVIKPEGEVFIGQSNVDTGSNGYPVSSEWVIDHSSGDVYAIVGAGSVNVRIMEER